MKTTGAIEEIYTIDPILLKIYKEKQEFLITIDKNSKKKEINLNHTSCNKIMKLLNNNEILLIKYSILSIPSSSSEEANSSCKDLYSFNNINDCTSTNNISSDQTYKLNDKSINDIKEISCLITEKRISQKNRKIETLNITLMNKMIIKIANNTPFTSEDIKEFKYAFNGVDNIYDYIKEYLEEYYCITHLPKHNLYYIKENDVNYIKVIDIKKKQFYISIPDFISQSSSLSYQYLENKDAINPNVVHYFNPMIYFAFRYCQWNNLPINKTRLYAVDDGDLFCDIHEPYCLVKDIEGKVHFMKFRKINFKKPNAELFDQRTKKIFKPKDVENLNVNNEVDLIYKLHNEKGKCFFAYYTFIKHLIRDFEHGEELQNKYIIYNIELQKEVICKEEIMRMLLLTNIGKCLINSPINQKWIKVSIIGESEIIIKREKLVEFLYKIQNGIKLPSKEKCEMKGNKYSIINPYKIRPLLYSQKNNEIIPYEFICKQYFEAHNIQTKQRIFLEKTDILQILSNLTKKEIYADNNRFCVNELKCALNPENELNARIVVTDAKEGEMLIRKKYLYQMLLSLYENRPIPKYLNIKGNLIPLQRELMINTQISLSSYIIDNILQENENTYTYNEETKALINSPYNYRNDLYEYIKVKDIYNRSLFVRKPFIRQVICKGKIIGNVTTLDFEGYSRILSVIEIIKNKYSNSPEIEIDDKYIYYEIENNYIQNH